MFNMSPVLIVMVDYLTCCKLLASIIERVANCVEMHTVIIVLICLLNIMLWLQIRNEKKNIAKKKKYVLNNEEQINTKISL